MAKNNSKKICAYYEKHGWRATISEFRVSPVELSEITKSVRKVAAKKAAEEKAAKKAAKADKKAEKKAAKKAAKKSKKKGKKKAAKKAPKKKAAKAAKPTKKKSAKKKSSKKKAAKRKAKKPTPMHSGDNIATVLDFLLEYRSKNQKLAGMMQLDSVIIDLTTQVRGV